MESKSRSFKIDCYSSFEGKNDNTPSTPTIKPTKEMYQYRKDRRMSNAYSFTPRSSSIQSVRSNTNIVKNKKMKSKKKTGKNLKGDKKSKERQSKLSDSSDSNSEISKSPRSATFKIKDKSERQ